jgi:CubicO group peptidase (beta-lactamase class C family)
MRKIILLFLTLSFWSCSKGQVSKAVNALDPSVEGVSTKQIEAIYTQVQRFPNQTQLSMGIIQNGEVQFAGIIRKNDSIFWTDNTQKSFEIGSITKVFTSTLLANFVLENKLKLDDNIQEYLDVELNTEEKITFKSLANHTSGLPRLPSNLNLTKVDPNNPYATYDENKLTVYLSSELKLNKSPGEKYDYSNLGAGLLGYELAKISNTTYEDLLQKMIFKKYGMLNSTSLRANVSEPLVTGLDPEGKSTSNWDFDALASAGAIFSSVKDLSKFAIAQFNADNEELQLTHQPTFKINKNMSIGLGWHLITRKKGKQVIWHNGGTGGYTSSMALNIEDQKGVIILSNVSAFNKNMGNIDRLCFELIESLDED